MTIFIGADHRGFKLKEELKAWLSEEGHEVVDCGNTKHDPEDDYPDFGKAVAQRVIANTSSVIASHARGGAKQSKSGETLRQAQDDNAKGIVLCGSGVGLCIAANRHRGIYCALAFDEKQIYHARRNDHINMISLPSDFVDLEKAKKLVNVFLETELVAKEKYIRRLKKMDE